MSTTTVWLARHGEVHNPTDILYGRLPRMGLSVEGQRQASALSTFLQSRRLAAVYSSPMLRARNTARVILERQPQLHSLRLTRDLIEIQTGWQGEPLSALESINWDFYANPKHPQDESLQAISQRMHRWLRKMLRTYPGQEVLGVSHGDPILILVGTLQGLPLTTDIFPRPYIEPATVYRIQFDANQACTHLEQFVPHAEKAA